jgi:selenophosphate synthetase-related protein
MLEPTSHLLERVPVGHGAMSASAVAGWIGLIWYLTVLVVCALGYFQMYVWITSVPCTASVECELWLTRILEPQMEIFSATAAPLPVGLRL